MSLPRYPEYKDSGVEWLGKVPAHWRPLHLKRVVERSDGGVWGDEPEGEGDTIVLRSTEQTVDGRWRIDDPAKRRLSERERLSATLEEGDLLVTKSSGSALHIGKTTIVDKDVAELGACYSNFMQRIRVADGLSPRFAWYLLNNEVARIQFDLASNSTTGLANLNGSMIGALLLVVPPLEEQKTIVDFLDRENSKIDALIAEQEKLLALLAEKRQATISHAVTRGLDPNVPMKDSGVPWLGDVPAHWEVMSLRKVVLLQRGHDLPADAREEGAVPVVSSGGFIGFHNESRASGPGVVTGRYGSIGSFVYVEEDYWPLNTALYSVELHGNDARYVWYLLLSVAEHFVLNSMKSAVPGVDRNDVHAVAVARPLVAEQKAIATQLDAVLESLDDLGRECQSAIALLRERRAALISAAVTGQIDVRGLVDQEAA